MVVPMTELETIQRLPAYAKVRHLMRPGDVVVFSGRAVISRLIQFFSRSPVTHAACVRQAMHQDGPYDVMVTESTISKTRNGPQTNPLSEILTMDYGLGSQASWLPLDEDFRKRVDFDKFYAFIGGVEDHCRYDIEGLVLYAAKFLPTIGPFIEASEDPRQMFCDAYIIALFEASGALRGINYRKMTPQDLCEMSLYSKSVPIFGRPLVIRNFNSV